MCFISLQVQAINLPFINKEVPFEITIKGVETAQEYHALFNLINDGIKQQRANNLSLKQYKDPIKISRFEQDIIRRILKSQGYYRAFVSDEKISATVTETDLNKTPEPANKRIKIINYLITPGAQYLISDISYRLDKNINLDLLPILPIQKNMPLIADEVLQSREKIRTFILQNYCFFQVKIDYQVIIDHETSKAKVIYSMSPSHQTLFGPISIQGTESINQDYLMSFIKYKEVECFRQDQIDASRLSILSSNLISNVSVNINNVDNNQVTTAYKVTERNHRTIKAGIGYSTDEGTYLSAGWEHRNIKGSGEKLDINTRISTIRQKVLGEFFIPNFFNVNKSLTLYSEAQNEELDSYKALSMKAGAKVGFKRTKNLNYFFGAELKVSDVNDAGDKEGFYLLSLPLEITWDHTNNILDPTAGFLVSSEIRPYIDIINTDTKFYKTMFSVSAYHTFDIDFQPTIAWRYSIGTITGESVEKIPADERFYVGGGGSIRGYPYQSLSKLDGDDPEGGASFQQINSELRIRFLENWGLATFAGGGYAFSDATPDFNATLLWGAGFGVRYYTSFAPFRFDLAFPLNKREGFDDDFQIYVSIGQAF